MLIGLFGGIRMRIALICPSNLLYMPYVSNYERILKENYVDYDIINWDRFSIEKESEFTYRDSKIGHQRSFLDYFKFSRFVLNILRMNRYDKVIVFGIQLVFFFKRYLIKEYSNKFIIDIRDYNRIIKYFNIGKLIDNSNFTVLSSPGYKDWLPKSNKYVINHNTQIERLDELRKVEREIKNKDIISISYIGSIRDYKINTNFIDSLKNKKHIALNFHGEGSINKDIENYVIDQIIDNVRLTGRYEKEEEAKLYKGSDFINVLIPNDSINSRTLLPNRLYNAAVYGKPIIAFKGTYLSEIIKKYNLGIVVGSFFNIEREIMEYINNFNFELYEKGRSSFFGTVIEENKEFSIRIKKFISEN